MQLGSSDASEHAEQKKKKPVGAVFFAPRVDQPKFDDAPCQNAILNQNTRTLHAGAPFSARAAHSLTVFNGNMS